MKHYYAFSLIVFFTSMSLCTYSQDKKPRESEKVEKKGLPAYTNGFSKRPVQTVNKDSLKQSHKNVNRSPNSEFDFFKKPRVFKDSTVVKRDKGFLLTKPVE
jgi:hypothetical protein